MFVELGGALVSLALVIIGWVIKDMKRKIDETMTEEEIRQLISDKLEPMRVDQRHIREDITEIKDDVKSLVRCYVDKRD